MASSVRSDNTVGFYNLVLPGGFSMIANQLDNGDNNLNTIIPDAPVGSEILKWNNGLQQFAPADTFFGAAFGGWVDQFFAPTATTLVRGEGAFINMAAAATLTLVGEVPEGTLDVTLNPGFSIVSQPTPQSIGVQAEGLSDGVATVGDEILFWIPGSGPGTQTYEPALTFFGSAFGGWVDQFFAPTDPTPEVGESFFYNSANPSPATWTRVFNVN